MGATSAPITLEEKRAAWEAVLVSRTLERSEQLRSFLRYICEAEAAGRADGVTEYSIGVEALGRPPDFSPSEDSTVRNRAYALRKKLEEFYATEAPPDLLRIELPKGSYTPRFVAPARQLMLATPSAVAPRWPPPARPAGAKWPILGAAVLVGAILAALVLWIGSRDRLRPKPAPSIQRVWQGMLEVGGTVLVSVATPPQSFIRPFPEPNPTLPGVMEVEEPVRNWYRRMRPGATAHLGQLPTFNSPLWGDAAGAFEVAALLNKYGVRTELLAERLVSTPAFRNRNVVLFGNPEYSPAIERLLRGMPMQIGYDSPSGEHIAFVLDTKGQIAKRFVPLREQSTSHLTQVYGLITIIPSEGDGGHSTRFIIVSGVTSAGTQAAAEFLTSPSHLQELLGKIGGQLPPRIQVLVRASTNRTVALSFAIETYRILP